MPNLNLLYPTSYVLIVLGLLFAVVPVLPGSLVVWLGIFAWANADGFHAFGWPTLIALAILAVLDLGADIFLTTWISRKSGASWIAVLGAIAGGIAGGLLLGGLVPILGTIIGGVIGSVVGVIVVEMLMKRNLGQAFKAGGGYIVGYLMSSALRLLICLVMIAVFLLQAFVLHPT